MLSEASTQKPVAGSRSLFRLILVGGCVALLLVVLFQNVSPKLERKEMMMQEDMTRPERACVDRLTEKMNKLGESHKKVSHLAREIPSSAETTIATVNADGSVSKLAWNDKNLERISAQYRFNRHHKFIHFPETGHRMLVYSDNTVVDLDTRKCVVVGVFERAPGGELHPLIRDAIKPQMGVASDKGCSKDQQGRCYRDGQYCRDEMFSMGRGQWTKPGCPSGWNKDCSIVGTFGCSQPQYTCGCGTACRDPLKCDDLGSRGKYCSLSRNQCNLVSGLGGSITDTSTIVGNIQTAVDVGAALISLIPGGGVVGVFSALFGFTGNLGMTGEQAYNKVLGKLNELATDIMACIKIQITEEIMRQIQTNLISMENNMRPLSSLEGSTAANRILHIWNANTPRCVQVGSHFETLKSKAEAYQILPLGLKAAQLCMANYIGLLADLTTEKQQMSILVIRKYRTMFEQLSSSISSVINKFYTSFSGVNQCGFYTSDKNLLNGQKTYLTDNVLANVNKLKAAFNKCPTTNVARGKATSQSSIGWNGASSRAVDGNRNTGYNANSCTHTLSNSNEYWYVDLGGIYEVCSVKITNRGDCCSTRLSNFDIFVADNTPTKTYPVMGSVGDTCAYKSGAVGSGATETFPCTNTVTGRYVNIRLRGRNYLTLCEVEVFGRRLL